MTLFELCSYITRQILNKIENNFSFSLKSIVCRHKKSHPLNIGLSFSRVLNSNYSIVSIIGSLFLFLKLLNKSNKQRINLGRKYSHQFLKEQFTFQFGSIFSCTQIQSTTSHSEHVFYSLVVKRIVKYESQIKLYYNTSISQFEKKIYILSQIFLPFPYFQFNLLVLQ